MFDFDNVTNEIEQSINKISNVDLLTIPYVIDPLIIETLFFNLYKIIIKIQKNNGLYEIILCSNGLNPFYYFKDIFYQFTLQYHFKYKKKYTKEYGLIIIWYDIYFKIIEAFDNRFFIVINPNITIKDKEYLINLFDLTTFQENLKFVEVKEQNILKYIKEYV